MNDEIYLIWFQIAVGDSINIDFIFILSRYHFIPRLLSQLSSLLYIFLKSTKLQLSEIFVRAPNVGNVSDDLPK